MELILHIQRTGGWTEKRFPSSWTILIDMLGESVFASFDSVSSHVDHDVFRKAKSKEIKLYRILPNTTHLMQPLDKGVFGPLKSKWYLTSRKYSRENRGKAIGKENFALKLSETFLNFTNH